MASCSLRNISRPGVIGFESSMILSSLTMVNVPLRPPSPDSLCFTSLRLAGAQAFQLHHNLGGVAGLNNSFYLKPQSFCVFVAEDVRADVTEQEVIRAFKEAYDLSDVTLIPGK